jgi:hypothetical protein
VSARKEMQKVLKRCKKAGCTVKQNRKSHYIVYLPGGGQITVSNSPRTETAARKVVSQLRNMGLAI